MDDRIAPFLEEIFAEDGLYNKAKTACIRMEIECSGADHRFAYEFRDALDHVSFLVSGAYDDESLEKHKQEVKTHLLTATQNYRIQRR